MGHFNFLGITLHSLLLYLFVQKLCSSKEESLLLIYFSALLKCGLKRNDEIVPSAVGHVGDTAPFPSWWVGEDLQRKWLLSWDLKCMQSSYTELIKCTRLETRRMGQGENPKQREILYVQRPWGKRTQYFRRHSLGNIFSLLYSTK